MPMFIFIAELDSSTAIQQRTMLGGAPTLVAGTANEFHTDFPPAFQHIKNITLCNL